jgi:hypothetical protein
VLPGRGLESALEVLRNSHLQAPKLHPQRLGRRLKLLEEDRSVGLVANANFRDVNIGTATKILQYPSARDFVLRYVAGSALGGFFATADESVQSALLDDVTLALSNYVSDHGLAFPIESNVLVAQK